MSRRPRSRVAWAAPLAVLFLLTVIACQDETVAAARRSKMPQSKTIGFISVGNGPFAWKPRSTGFGPQCLLIRSRAAWTKLAGSFSLSPELSAADGEARLARVDFARQSILAVTLGEAGSTGSNIHLEHIEAGPPPVLVMTSTHPGADEMTGAMMTHPFHLVIVDVTSLAPDLVFMKDGKQTEFERHVFE